MTVIKFHLNSGGHEVMIKLLDNNVFSAVIVVLVAIQEVALDLGRAIMKGSHFSIDAYLAPRYNLSKQASSL